MQEKPGWVWVLIPGDKNEMQDGLPPELADPEGEDDEDPVENAAMSIAGCYSSHELMMQDAQKMGVSRAGRLHLRVDGLEAILARTYENGKAEGAKEERERWLKYALTGGQNDYVRTLISNYLDYWSPTQEQRDALRPINDLLYKQKYYGFVNLDKQGPPAPESEQADEG